MNKNNSTKINNVTKRCPVCIQKNCFTVRIDVFPLLYIKTFLCYILLILRLKSKEKFLFL